MEGVLRKQTSFRAETLRLAYVTILRLEGKQIHILCTSKTLPMKELRWRATKYCSWEITFIVWAIYASLAAFTVTHLIPLHSIYSGRQQLSFAPATLLGRRVGVVCVDTFVDSSS
jgi:hypothetical protein